MSECLTCSEIAKSEKKIRLDNNRANKEKEGVALAKGEGANGFFIALAKNETGYIVALTRPEGSSLEWGYVSIL